MCKSAIWLRYEHTGQGPGSVNSHWIGLERIGYSSSMTTPDNAREENL